MGSSAAIEGGRSENAAHQREHAEHAKLTNAGSPRPTVSFWSIHAVARRALGGAGRSRRPTALRVGAAVIALSSCGAAASGGSAPSALKGLETPRALSSGTSATRIPDPSKNLAPDPYYPDICAPKGLDDSTRCIQAILAAIDNARQKEGVKPMLLPSDFAKLSVPDQLLVVIDRERVDRGLPPFPGLTATLDRNSMKGARTATDPPDPGAGYEVVDTEWAGGASNGLDADYGWMYDDGPGSANLDCPRAGESGCWGHRNGILDDFGTVGTMLMGAAFDRTGDDNAGDRGGTSMAATLAVAAGRHGPFVYTWARAVADTPRQAFAGTHRQALAGTPRPKADIS